MIAGRARRAQDGFTLLELLVAILVFAVMAVMAYGGLDAVLSDRDSLQRGLDRTAGLQKALYRLERDLANVRSRPIRGQYGEVKPAFMAPPEGMVSFTSGGVPNPLHQRRSTLERVAYALDDHKLERLRWFDLDRAPGSHPEKTTLLKGVDKITWRFTAANGQSYSQWPPPNEPDTQNPPTPVSAEVTLETRQWGKLRLLMPIETGNHRTTGGVQGNG